MTKYKTIFFACILIPGFASAGDIPSAGPLATTIIDSAVPSYRLIVPGKRIGLSSLNAKSSLLLKSLGKPDMDDAAMGGKNLSTWYSKAVVHGTDTVINETDIYFTTPNFGMRNQVSLSNCIRITSPYFVTKQQLGTGSSLSSILKYFPKIKRTASYISPKTKQDVFIYDDSKGGIAFEIDGQQQCTGIMIHKPGEMPTVIYSSLFGEVKEESAASAPAIHIGLQDNGKTFMAGVNEKFDATFNECRGCRYVWEISAIDKNAISFLENTYANPSCTNCTGGNQDHTFHLQVKARGRSVITFKYGEQTVTVTINAR
jgi:predicted secreted protein